jgi:hypothetical protein
MTLGIMLLAQPAVQADTAAEMLEKGIYNEETVGNLDEAIKIYREVVNVASQTQKLAAKAQFRLGQCLLKQQKKDDAVAAFKTLISKYPDQKELVAKAKQHLPDELRLSKAPWKDGERLTLTMKLPGGQTVGIIGLHVETEVSDGTAAWKMSVRRFLGAGQNEGVSSVTVDQSTNRPRKTSWEHTILGTADAAWHDDKIVISTKGKDGKREQKKVAFDDVAYANDQWFYGFRQLPLAVGYQVTIPIRVAFTGGNAIGLEIDVSKKETIDTPVGQFDCFRLDTNIQQTFWIADVPERYIVQFSGGGVEATLSSIGKPDSPSKVINDKLGLSLTVPDGWHFYELAADNDDNDGVYQFVAPQMASAQLKIRNKSQLDPDDQDSVDAWADSRIERGKRIFKTYEVRPDSRKDARFAGSDAKTFVADCQIQGAFYTREVTLAATESKAIAIDMVAKKSEFEIYGSQFDALRKSISVR